MAYEMKWEYEMKKELTNHENNNKNNESNKNRSNNKYVELVLNCLILGPLPTHLVPLCPVALS